MIPGSRSSSNQFSKTINFNKIELGYTIEARGVSPRLIQQVHGGNIVEASSHVPEADGIYTFKINEPIHIFTADCIPLLFFCEDPLAPLLAIHCGWRGALNRIAAKGSEFFTNQSSPAHVVIGPSILDCCFQVREDLVHAFHQEGHTITSYLSHSGENLYFNLVNFVCDTQLKDCNIDRSWNRCTVCSHPELPSYRRNRSTNPQLRSWIVKKS